MRSRTSRRWGRQPQSHHGRIACRLAMLTTHEFNRKRVRWHVTSR
jgi:hypothetical protein